MSATCLSTLYAGKVTSSDDTTEKTDCHNFYNPGSIFELDWVNQPVIKCSRSLSDFKTSRLHFSDVLCLPLEWKDTVFPTFSTPSWFISFETATWLNQLIKLEVKWKNIFSVLLSTAPVPHSQLIASNCSMIWLSLTLHLCTILLFKFFSTPISLACSLAEISTEWSSSVLTALQNRQGTCISLLFPASCCSPPWS